ncbi:hypothetical protein ENSA7_27360 [Enhygromyxa salina]|uniref:Uncharacterized protein n=1 Tax=Enhygromyxa salina TaxID=215803 RepID=A0A2S9YR09_9BACT|nr:hypothetical protein ENSA7_27360 [Enhygromyxa salina]
MVDERGGPAERVHARVGVEQAEQREAGGLGLIGRGAGQQRAALPRLAGDQEQIQEQLRAGRRVELGERGIPRDRACRRGGSRGLGGAGQQAPGGQADVILGGRATRAAHRLGGVGRHRPVERPKAVAQQLHVRQEVADVLGGRAGDQHEQVAAGRDQQVVDHRLVVRDHELDRRTGGQLELAGPQQRVVARGPLGDQRLGAADALAARRPGLAHHELDPGVLARVWIRGVADRLGVGDRLAGAEALGVLVGAGGEERLGGGVDVGAALGLQSVDRRVVDPGEHGVERLGRAQPRGQSILGAGQHRGQGLVTQPRVRGKHDLGVGEQLARGGEVVGPGQQRQRVGQHQRAVGVQQDQLAGQRHGRLAHARVAVGRQQQELGHVTVGVVRRDPLVVREAEIFRVAVEQIEHRLARDPGAREVVSDQGADRQRVQPEGAQLGVAGVTLGPRGRQHLRGVGGELGRGVVLDGGQPGEQAVGVELGRGQVQAAHGRAGREREPAAIDDVELPDDLLAQQRAPVAALTQLDVVGLGRDRIERELLHAQLGAALLLALLGQPQRGVEQPDWIIGEIRQPLGRREELVEIEAVGAHAIWVIEREVGQVDGQEPAAPELVPQRHAALGRDLELVATKHAQARVLGQRGVFGGRVEIADDAAGGRIVGLPQLFADDRPAQQIVDRVATAGVGEQQAGVEAGGRLPERLVAGPGQGQGLELAVASDQVGQPQLDVAILHAQLGRGGAQPGQDLGRDRERLGGRSRGLELGEQALEPELGERADLGAGLANAQEHRRVVAGQPQLGQQRTVELAAGGRVDQLARAPVHARVGEQQQRVADSPELALGDRQGPQRALERWQRARAPSQGPQVHGVGAREVERVLGGAGPHVGRHEPLRIFGVGDRQGLGAQLGLMGELGGERQSARDHALGHAVEVVDGRRELGGRGLPRAHPREREPAGEPSQARAPGEQLVDHRGVTRQPALEKPCRVGVGAGDFEQQVGQVARLDQAVLEIAQRHAGGRAGLGSHDRPVELEPGPREVGSVGGQLAEQRGGLILGGRRQTRALEAGQPVAHARQLLALEPGDRREPLRAGVGRAGQRVEPRAILGARHVELAQLVEHVAAVLIEQLALTADRQLRAELRLASRDSRERAGAGTLGRVRVDGRRSDHGQRQARGVATLGLGHELAVGRARELGVLGRGLVLLEVADPARQRGRVLGPRLAAPSLERRPAVVGPRRQRDHRVQGGVEGLLAGRARRLTELGQQLASVAEGPTREHHVGPTQREREVVGGRVVAQRHAGLAAERIGAVGGEIGQQRLVLADLPAGEGVEHDLGRERVVIPVVGLEQRLEPAPLIRATALRRRAVGLVPDQIDRLGARRRERLWGHARRARRQPGGLVAAPAQPLQRREHVRVARERVPQPLVAPAQVGLVGHAQRPRDRLALALGREHELRGFYYERRVEHLVADLHREHGGRVELRDRRVELRRVTAREPDDQQSRAGQVELLTRKPGRLVRVAELGRELGGQARPSLAVVELAKPAEVPQRDPIAQRLAVERLVMGVNGDAGERAGAGDRRDQDQE